MMLLHLNCHHRLVYNRKPWFIHLRPVSRRDFSPTAEPLLPTVTLYTPCNPLFDCSDVMAGHYSLLYNGYLSFRSAFD